MTHIKAHGAHITEAEWDIIKGRYIRGVSKEVLMREHRFHRSAWRQHLMMLQKAHEARRREIAIEMEQLYRKAPSTPIHIVSTYLNIESSVTSEVWPVVRRTILRAREFQTAMIEKARELKQTISHSTTLRDQLGRAFGYRDWEGLRKSVVWHKDLYRALVDVIETNGTAPESRFAPESRYDHSHGAGRALPLGERGHSSDQPKILGQESSIRYVAVGGDVWWSYNRTGDPLRYYSTLKSWPTTKAFQRISSHNGLTNDVI